MSVQHGPQPVFKSEAVTSTIVIYINKATYHVPNNVYGLSYCEVQRSKTNYNLEEPGWIHNAK